MRPVILGVLALELLAVSPAIAEKTGGSGGGGGRLGQVSSGIGSATRGGGGSSGSSSGGTIYPECDRSSWARQDTVVEPAEPPAEEAEAAVAGKAPAPKRDGATFQAYVGAQKVYESTGSFSLELSAIDRRFRLDGGVTRYYEDRMDGGRLTMTMWTLTGGLRIDDGGPSRVFLEGGVVGAKTQADPDGDSSLTGSIGGVRVEHKLSKRTTLVGDTHAMFFKHDVRAYGGRVGIQLGHIQASLRVLDFNVGPALFGPELGMRF